MTRSNAVLSSVLAIILVAFAAIPAAASEDYSSINSIMGAGGSVVDPSVASDYSSLNATLNGVAADLQANVPSAPSGGQPSINAVLGSDGIPVPGPVVSVEGGSDGGFAWGEAALGALGGSLLLLFALVGARTVARHRRAITEPRG